MTAFTKTSPWPTWRSSFSRRIQDGNGEIGFDEFKQMIATIKAREAENRKSGESLSYLEWMLRGGGAPASTAAASPSLANADKGNRDGDAGDASSLFLLVLFEPSWSSSSALDDKKLKKRMKLKLRMRAKMMADTARAAVLAGALNKHHPRRMTLTPRARQRSHSI